MTDVAIATAVAPTSDGDISPEDVPLPRSSMITVRLSEVDLKPVLDAVPEQDASQDPSAPQSSPSSTRSSRSSSKTSDSSTSIDTVDWEELDKTEEQEPKDVTSDEVGNTGQGYIQLCTDMSSQPHSS